MGGTRRAGVRQCIRGVRVTYNLFRTRQRMNELLSPGGCLSTFVRVPLSTTCDGLVRIVFQVITSSANPYIDCM